MQKDGRKKNPPPSLGMPLERLGAQLGEPGEAEKVQKKKRRQLQGQRGRRHRGSGLGCRGSCSYRRLAERGKIDHPEHFDRYDQDGELGGVDPGVNGQKLWTTSCGGGVRADAPPKAKAITKQKAKGKKEGGGPRRPRERLKPSGRRRKKRDAELIC